MSLKTTIQSIVNRIKTVSIVNQEGATVNMPCTLWNNQPTRRQEGTGYTYTAPVCFVELEFSNGASIGGGATAYDVMVRVLFENAVYNTEGSLDEDFSTIEAQDKIHFVLNNFQPEGCSPLQRSGMTIDVEHGNSPMFVMQYATHWIDVTGSIYDPNNTYQLLTLDDPDTMIGAEIVEELPDSLTFSQQSELFDIIEEVAIDSDGGSLTLTLQASSTFGIDGAEVVSTYTLDWGDDTTESIALNQSISHVYEGLGAVVDITITSSNGASMIMQAYIDEGGSPISYISHMKHSCVYDLSGTIDPSYPVQVDSEATVVDGIFSNFKVFHLPNTTQKTEFARELEMYRHQGILLDTENQIKTEAIYRASGGSSISGVSTILINISPIT